MLRDTRVAEWMLAILLGESETSYDLIDVQFLRPRPGKSSARYTNAQL